MHPAGFVGLGFNLKLLVFPFKADKDVVLFQSSFAMQ
jgi:hypothetical protein